MRRARFALTSKLLVLLALAGFVLGCGQQGGTVPVPDEEKSKQIGDEMKAAHKEMMRAKGQLKGKGPR